MRIVKIIFFVLLAVFVIMQFIQPQKNISKTTAATDIIKSTNMPKSLANTLQVSCYDCHSNNTNYPWYNNIAPVSYWMADHVKEGKHHLNFSEWKNYNIKRKLHKLEEIVEEVKEGHMPIASYVWMHNEAKLNDQQIIEIEQWITNYSLQIQLSNMPQ